MVRFVSTPLHAAALKLAGRPRQVGLIGFKLRDEFFRPLKWRRGGVMRCTTSSFTLVAMKSEDNRKASVTTLEHHGWAHKPKPWRREVMLWHHAKPFRDYNRDQKVGMRMRSKIPYGPPKVRVNWLNDIHDELRSDSLNRVGVLATKKQIGLKAVNRNRARRRIMHACRDVMSYYGKHGYDIICIARPPCLVMPYEDLRVEMASALKLTGVAMNDLPVHNEPPSGNDFAKETPVYALQHYGIVRKLYSKEPAEAYARAIFSDAVRRDTLEMTMDDLNRLSAAVLKDGHLLTYLTKKADDNARETRLYRAKTVLQKLFLAKPLRAMLISMAEANTLHEIFQVVLNVKKLVKRHEEEKKSKSAAAVNPPLRKTIQQIRARRVGVDDMK
jgi:ribonuclease P protein component